jgi:hypothetical protein
MRVDSAAVPLGGRIRTRPLGVAHPAIVAELVR